jgi:capsular polysaccharide transport system ATP-binding protein
MSGLAARKDTRAIELKNVSKFYRISKFRRKVVLDDITASIPHDTSLGIMGKNGAGKSTLVNMISGVEYPSRGTVLHNGLRMSWPIGRGAVQGSLTARNNVKFICRVTGKDVGEAVRFVEDLTELGAYMDMPVKTFSSGMKSRLALAMSLIPEYDCYLVDEGFNAGTPRFTERFNEVFRERCRNANMVCISHNVSVIRRFCNKAAILDGGKLHIYDDMEEAIATFGGL